MEQTEGHVLHIYLVGDGLKELRRGFRPLKPGHCLRMALLGEVPPSRLLAPLHVMDHLELFLYKTHLETEYLDILFPDDTSGHLGLVARMDDRRAGYRHGIIIVGSV